MKIRLDDRVALVTGAASGIGYAIAAGLLEAGATVVIADINTNAAQQAAAELGSCAIAKTVDIRDVQACRQLIQTIIDETGQLDILVNNAGIGSLHDIETVDETFFDNMFAVNVRGAFFLSQAAAHHMKARQTGRIINISSVGGRTGGSLSLPVYAATKAALFSVTKSFASYLAPHGTANTIAPGPSHTALTANWNSPEGLEFLRSRVPLGRLGIPDDYKGIAVFLASDYASYITGATIDVNGGFRMD